MRIITPFVYKDPSRRFDLSQPAVVIDGVIYASPALYGSGLNGMNKKVTLQAQYLAEEVTEALFEMLPLDSLQEDYLRDTLHLKKIGTLTIIDHNGVSR